MISTPLGQLFMIIIVFQKQQNLATHILISTILTLDTATTTLDLAPHSYEEVVDKRFPGSTSTPDQQSNNYVSRCLFVSPPNCEEN